MSAQMNPCRHFTCPCRSLEGNFATRGPKLTDIATIVFIISKLARASIDDFIGLMRTDAQQLHLG